MYQYQTVPTILIMFRERFSYSDWFLLFMSHTIVHLGYLLAFLSFGSKRPNFIIIIISLCNCILPPLKYWLLPMSAHVSNPIIYTTFKHNSPEITSSIFTWGENQLSWQISFSFFRKKTVKSIFMIGHMRTTQAPSGAFTYYLITEGEGGGFQMITLV